MLRQPFHQGEQFGRWLIALRQKADHRRVDLRRRREGFRWKTQSKRHVACPLRQHRQPSIGRRIGRRDDPRADLLLKHQRQPLERRNLPQPSDKQRSANVIGQIRDDLPRCRDQLGQIQR